MLLTVSWYCEKLCTYIYLNDPPVYYCTFKSHSMSECDSSDHPVSVVFGGGGVVVNFLLFQLLLSNHCTDELQLLCGCSFDGLLLNLLNSGCYPYF